MAPTSRETLPLATVSPGNGTTIHSNADSLSLLLVSTTPAPLETMTRFTVGKKWKRTDRQQSKPRPIHVAILPQVQGCSTATNALGDDAISIAFGHRHACALIDSGEVKCWGRNNAGQLGPAVATKILHKPLI